MTGSKRDQMCKAFESDAITVVDKARYGVSKLKKLHGYCTINAPIGDFRTRSASPSSLDLCDNRHLADLDSFAGNPDFVLSLARGLSIIEAFQGHPEGVTVSDVAQRTGLSRAAVRRSLMTLELLGYVSRSGSTLRLGSRVLRLGFSFLSSNSLPMLALPILQEISTALQESSSISILEGDEIVYLARSATNRVMSVGLSVGSRLPAYCTSMGRVLLSALPEAELGAYLDRVELRAQTPKTLTLKTYLAGEIGRVRQQGFSLVDEELELGLRSLAVPVETRTGRVAAAMNTGVHASRVTPGEMLERFLPVLREGAQRLGCALD